MKTIHLLLFISFIAFPLTSFTQISNISWEKQSQVRGIDFFTDIIEDVNEGYTVVGSKKTKGKSLDYWIVRYTAKGDTIWTKTLGTEYKDIPKKIIQLTDKSYILMGTSQKENANNLFLLRIDENGTELWRKIFESDEFLSAEDLVSLEENAFTIVGAKGANRKSVRLWMATMSNNGEIIWEKTFLNNLMGCIKSIKRLPVGGFALAGQVGDTGKNNCDIIAMRTDEDGNITWSSRIETPDKKVWPECICCSPDSCFMLVGWQGTCFGDINSENPVFDFDLLLTKIDCDGKVLWTKNFDREGSEGGNAVTICSDGNFIVAGIKMSSFLGKVGPWLLHVDAEGNELNEQLLKFRFHNDHATKVINCSDGGFIVIGPGIQEDENTRSDGWIIKFASTQL
jgi:hypothetical protein